MKSNMKKNLYINSGCKEISKTATTINGDAMNFHKSAFNKIFYLTINNNRNDDVS